MYSVKDIEWIKFKKKASFVKLKHGFCQKTYYSKGFIGKGFGISTEANITVTLQMIVLMIVVHDSVKTVFNVQLVKSAL